jgi:CubicO group peptidase (beta-lactamase class C family)
MRRRAFLRGGLALTFGGAAGGLRACGADEARSQIERGLAERMAHDRVPGVSVALIHGQALEWAEGYGHAEAGTSRQVKADTLFQAASISKPVTAMAALRLVQEGKLDLDSDVNEMLRSWKVPASPAANGKPVTLRLLLKHSAGLNVHGFGGYKRGARIPTLRQVLDGKSPANSKPIHIEYEPGTKVQYSGGGYCVVQQLIEDVTGKPFPAAMRELVLDRIGTTTNTFDQPLPEARMPFAACGHDSKGSVIPGCCHVYPEMAAAGLWTTPSDLARFGIELAKSANGQSNRVLDTKFARLMTSREHGGRLGLALTSGGAPGFSHNGGNAGFACRLVVLDSVFGAVVMTNGDNGATLFSEIVRRIMKAYSWPDHVF